MCIRDRVEGKEFELPEEMRKILAGLLNTGSNGLLVEKTGFDFLEPEFKFFGLSRTLSLLDDRVVRVEECEVNGLVGTVDTEVEVMVHDKIWNKWNTRVCSGGSFIGMS